VITIKSQMNPMTQQWISERFGMPTCGLAFGSTTLPSAVFGTSAPVVTSRKRRIEAIVGTNGHAVVAMRDLAYVPGTNAWSPPLC
jgi:hypothetical protein